MFFVPSKMPTVDIPDYHQKLASSEPKRISRVVPGRLGVSARKETVIIPPLNTQIDFQALPRYKTRGKNLMASSDLPTEFTWRPSGNGYTNPDDAESYDTGSIVNPHPSNAPKAKDPEYYHNLLLNEPFHPQELMAVYEAESRADPNGSVEGYFNQHALLSDQNGYYGNLAQHRRLAYRGVAGDHGVRHRRRGYLGLQRRVRTEEYDNNRTEIRKYISPVLNQAMCGSCWAVSTASAVGDVFAVAGKLPTDSSGNPVAPQPSATYVLGCYPQSQCGGGNPADLLTKIASDGIASQHCSDYSWCMNDDDCSGAATGHFKSEAEMTDAFNALIPSCGCYDDSNKKHVKFYVDSVSNMDLDSTKDFTNTLKSHIMTHGTVIGGFLVYDNFMGGKFTSDDNPEGVYFENVNYSGSGDYFLDSDPNFDGAHAVAIVGWGVAKNTKYQYTDPDSGKTVADVGDVPYWYVRNSWTDSWGDGGYFKIAMWPYNQKSQFDKVVTVKTSAGTTETGGVVAFTAKAFSGELDLGQASNVPAKLLQSNDYYSTELGGGEDPAPSNSDSDDDSSSNNDWVWWSLSAVAVLLLALFVWMLVRKNM